MRILVIMLILMGIIVAFATVMNNQTVEISDELLNSLEEVRDKVENEQWKKANDKLILLRDQWERADDFWTPFIDHREIDTIEESIVRISSFVEEHQKEDALAEINVAISMVERLRNREGPNIENIL